MHSALKEITSCEVCNNSQLEKALDLGLHPMCDDLVPIGDTRVCQEYPIEILYCQTCRTGHQRFQIPKQILFPTTYHYRARHTADVLNGMKQLAEASIEIVGDLKNKKVLDIGCNDGSLLSIFKTHGAQTFGIEPTGACVDAEAAGHQVMNEFLDTTVSKAFVEEYGQPDVITFTNVFAHIEDLGEVIRSLKILAHSNTTIVIENHYLGSVLDRHQFDTFYHEHPRTYSYTSFAYIADSLGIKIRKVEFPQRYGGNIRVFMGKTNDSQHHRQAELNAIEAKFGQQLSDLAQEIKIWQTKKQSVIAGEVNRKGSLLAKAFPGRAAIPIKLLGLDEDKLSAVYEKPQSAKIGHYIPGTRIPILSDDAFPPNPGPILNLAWHIAPEIETYMRQRGYQGEIIDIIESKDFQEVN
ncbi:MAG: methyltransferase domain-containing protein [Candidatus Obscuribacterales bacterium]|nr:methyltransferase domain-containing protein [Candidatus Obscuribacterales bacterium]